MRTLLSLPALILSILIPVSCRVAGGLSSTVSQNLQDPAPAPAISRNPVQDTTGLFALWVGHSTVLLQMDDKVILTDPFLTDHVAQVKIRIVEPGLDLATLRHCDLILLSHSHADHTNFGSLGILEKEFPAAHLVFPEGLEEFLPSYSFPLHRLRKARPADRIVAGETIVVEGVTVSAVAAFHWGGRYGLDGTLWGYSAYTGYIIQYHGMTVYFAGDTGYDEEYFKRLGDAYSIDLALIPIGPTYEPEGTGTPVHVFAAGALRILDDTKARTMIPIHFETTNEPFDVLKPRQVLEQLLGEEPEYRERVEILDIGGQVRLPAIREGG